MSKKRLWTFSGINPLCFLKFYSFIANIIFPSAEKRINDNKILIKLMKER